jgi:hypothetical protein
MPNELLGLHHKDLLIPRLKSLKVALSEYSFANLYLFREKHAYEIIPGPELFIKGRTYDNRSFLMPVCDVRTIDPGLLRERTGSVDFLFPLPEEWLAAFDASEYEISFERGDEDYLYTVQKMSTFAGRNLHKKRNLLKQFTTLYQHEARPLTNDRLADARAILQGWLAGSDTDASSTDFGPCSEALDRYEELVLCGGIFYAEGEPAGFLIGEETGPDTFVLHFAKALTKFKGVYQYMFNSFAKVLPPKYCCMNLEQDLDKENLRVFKESYVPDAMLKKARVSIRKRG